MVLHEWLNAALERPAESPDRGLWSNVATDYGIQGTIQQSQRPPFVGKEIVYIM